MQQNIKTTKREIDIRILRGMQMRGKQWFGFNYYLKGGTVSKLQFSSIQRKLGFKDKPYALRNGTLVKKPISWKNL